MCLMEGERGYSVRGAGVLAPVPSLPSLGYLVAPLSPVPRAVGRDSRAGLSCHGEGKTPELWL